ncbi:glycosyltransferase [Pseudomonas oryziphila]|uniref:Glycosyltransferase family 1 protein n=1 Tax=Pseudomonas oryziphila TaxID=2894079 RepID=A0ABM7CNB1_9PSED|nr:glycosyltransferase [Pseudomonas oryziphila]AZL72926.1 glycosyltransferase family 1 protein [Pseudomonas oryziphila]
MKRILIISFSAIHSDPRVMRQVRLLEGDYRLTVAGYGPRPDADIQFVPLERSPASIVRKAFWAAKLMLGAFDSYYWNQQQVGRAIAQLGAEKFDLVIANDVSSAPLAFRLAGEAPVMVDAHEYSPREFEDKRLWRMLFGRYINDLCARYLPRAASMTTVCRGIADEYARVYGVRPLVIHNAPVHQRLAPTPVVEGRIRLIHHGAAIRSRHLAVMIEMMGYLDQRFSLDFMLMDSDSDYLLELREAAKGDPRIRFIPPVPMPEICQHLNGYDIGVFLLPPVNFNYEHALPNKFFEFVQACLGVAIGPSPEMANLLRAYECGVVADSFAARSLAASLQQLDAEAVTAFKEASHAAAAELNYEHDGKRLLSEVARLV